MLPSDVNTGRSCLFTAGEMGHEPVEEGAEAVSVFGGSHCNVADAWCSGEAILPRTADSVSKVCEV